MNVRSLTNRNLIFALTAIGITLSATLKSSHAHGQNLTQAQAIAQAVAKAQAQGLTPAQFQAQALLRGATPIQAQALAQALAQAQAQSSSQSSPQSSRQSTAPSTISLVETLPSDSNYPGNVPYDSSRRPYKVALMDYNTARQMIDFSIVYASTVTDLAIAFTDLGNVTTSLGASPVTGGGIGYLWKWSGVTPANIMSGPFAPKCGAFAGVTGTPGVFDFTDLAAKNKAAGYDAVKGLRVVMPDIDSATTGRKSIVGDSCAQTTPAFASRGNFMQLWALFDPNATQLDRSTYLGIYIFSDATGGHVLMVKNPANGKVTNF